MKNIIFAIILLSVYANAFELRSWYLGNINSSNYEIKDTEFISKYNSENFDAMCLQGIEGEDSLKSISGDKQYLSSLDSKLSFLVKSSYKELDLIDFKDNNIIFDFNPQILFVKDINLVLINYLASDNPDKRIEELKSLNEVFYFANKTTKIERARIILCGNFKETYGFVKNHMNNLYSISNIRGTIIDEKFGFSNYDYDHIVGMYKFNVEPDEEILKKNKDYKKLIDRVSPHLPIKLKI